MKSISVVSIFSLMIGVGCYGVDMFLYHLSASLHLTSHGIFTTFWMLWCVHCLAKLPSRQNWIPLMGLVVIVCVHSVQSGMEVFLPWAVLWVWAVGYHAFFVISTTYQRRFFMIFSYALVVTLSHVKFALQMDHPWLYMWQTHWVVVIAINSVLYLILGERVFEYLQKWLRTEDAVYN